MCDPSPDIVATAQGSQGFGCPNTATGVPCGAQGILVLDTWTHVVVTSSSVSLMLYMNGALAKAVTTGVALNTITRTLNIANPAPQTFPFFQGSVAFIRIYN